MDEDKDEVEAQQSLVDVVVVVLLLLLFAVTGLDVVVLLRRVEMLRAAGFAFVVVLVVGVEGAR